jgi:hypothetical protein
MRVRIHTPNFSKIQKEQMRQSGNRTGYVSLSPNSRLYFYICPPWSEEGLLAKQVWECYNLPCGSDQNKKWRRHTAWLTHEKVSPGLGVQDPIMKVLSAVRESYPGTEAAKVADRSYPHQPKFYLNVIPVATVNLDSSKNELPDTYKAMDEIEVKKLNLSGAAFDELMRMVASVSSAESSPTHPMTAVQFGLGKTGTGKETRYNVITVGSNVPGKGIVPDVDNLVDKFGEPKVEDMLENLPDLDADFPVPTESQKVDTQMQAQALKDYFMKKLGVAQQPEQAPAPPQVQQQEAPPVAPAAVETPPVAAPAQITSADIMGRNLGLDAAPKNGGTAPICLKHIDKVSKSPNAAWCATCPFQTPCKVGAQALAQENPQ